ncbi:MAG: hypothetical protein ACP5NS_04635 [Candidatus Pacearchaeota archaeon]
MVVRLVRKGLVGLMTAGAILAGSVGLGGCRTGADQRFNAGLTTPQQYSQEKQVENNYNDGLALTLLGGLIGARGAQINNPGAVVFGNALSNHGAAQVSALDVLVNNNPGPVYSPPIVSGPYEVPVPQGPRVTLIESSNQDPLVLKRNIGGIDCVAVVSNYSKDFNGNGEFNYPEDFGGMKRVFLPSEKVTLSLVSEKQMPLKIEVIGSNGKVIESFESHGKYLGREYNSEISGRLPAESNYSGVFYVGGDLVGKLEFGVTERKWEFVQK